MLRTLLIGYAYGAKLSTLEKPVYDEFEEVRVIEMNEVFDGYGLGEHIPLVEYHNNYVRKQDLLEAGFTLLALYGIQFHAERFKIGSEELGRDKRPPRTSTNS